MKGVVATVVLTVITAPAWMLSLQYSTYVLIIFKLCGHAELSDIKVVMKTDMEVSSQHAD